MAWTTPYTFTAAILTAAQMNTYVSNNTAFLKINTVYGAAVSLTISGGAVTVTQSYHKIVGESSAADDLDTISGGSEGQIIVIRPNGYAITLKNGTGNLTLGGDILLSADTDHMALIYNGSAWLPYTEPLKAETFLANAFNCPAPGTDWTPDITGVSLAQSKSAKKCWLPLNFLKIGDIIISYKLVGDVTEADTATLDCKLVQVNKADPLTTTDITNGAITQVTADGNVDAEANCDNTTVATDKQYLLEINGTTGTGDSITVIGAEVLVYRL